ncbi:MAG TPA: Crp/Fnr family transcriptional regulator [Coleofasciculaceae cyanobacterium]|jgi:CRP-like cAMP-binding protein
MFQEQSSCVNHILLALPAREYQRLEPYLRPIPLNSGTVLYHADQPIDTIYFPKKALISLVSTLENGMTTETGIVGRTGIIGLPFILGRNRSYNRAMVQVPDGAMKISAQVVKNEFKRGEELQRLLLLYTEARLREVSQLAVCNRNHTIEERLARWLLTVQDLIEGDELPLTQEFIGNMLGVRRSGVTITAGTLQRAGMIRYARGKITILDREALEHTSCECYQLFHENYYGQ